MVLFRATSHHQLINAIAIKLTVLPQQTADIMLSNMTDFSFYIERIRATNIFRKVYYVDDKAVAKSFLALDFQNRLKASKKVQNSWNVELDPDIVYEDYYYGYEILCNKLFYYYLLTRQKPPVAHAFQEGVSSYVVNCFSRDKSDSIAHSHYGKKSLMNNLSDLYYYWPETMLFVSPIDTKRLSINYKNVKDAIKQIYQPKPLPKEKYIYIATCSEFQGVSSNEADLINKLVSYIGKENLVIKGHPRFHTDKFKPFGFSRLDSNVAWEAYISDDEIKNKVLISAMSTSLLSSVNMRPGEIVGLMMNRMFSCDLSRFVDNSSLNRYFAVVKQKLADYGGGLHEIANNDELKEHLIYWGNK